MSRILLLDDDDNFRPVTQALLEKLGHTVEAAADLASAKLCLQRRSFDHLLLDLMLPDGSGLEVLDRWSDEPALMPRVTIITGHPAVKEIFKSIYGPSVDYLIKPFDLAQLESALGSGRSAEKTKGDGKRPRHFEALVGESPAMKFVYEQIERVAPTKANVMLFGESGVGKEVIAKAIHDASGVSGPFVAINCGAIPTELVGSELFGHEKGAFTGAVDSKVGVFEQAQDGTLFLDEVTEMPIDQQTNLLRALETMEIKRVGGRKSIPVNCRIVSASNRRDHELVEGGVIREDLYFRLAVFPIKIASLRERLSDIPDLVNSFTEDLARRYGRAQVPRVNDEQVQRLKAYAWPGNVRELRHVIHRSFILTDERDSYLNIPPDFSSPFSGHVKANTGVVAGRTIEDVERELIHATLKETSGDKKRAAEMLGISLKTLYNRLNAYDASANESDI